MDSSNNLAGKPVFTLKEKYNFKYVYFILKIYIPTYKIIYALSRLINGWHEMFTIVTIQTAFIYLFSIGKRVENETFDWADEIYIP